MAKPKLPSGQLVNWDNTQLQTVYSNIMMFQLTPFDLSFTFGQIGDATKTEVEALAKVKLILAPEQAANLMTLIGIALQAYVEANGQLRTSGALNMENIKAEIEEKTGQHES